MEVPNSWMVYFMENRSYKWMITTGTLWPYDLGNLHLIPPILIPLIIINTNDSVAVCCISSPRLELAQIKEMEAPTTHCLFVGDHHPILKKNGYKEIVIDCRIIARII